jgi:tetratricopeptide (TPR) repeat protein
VRHPQLVAALAQGNIETAIQVAQTITTPQPEDVKPLSIAVRLMLDHLYIVDASDFEMPSNKARMDDALRMANLAIQADPQAPDGWAAKALALNWAYRSPEALIVIAHVRTLYPDNAGAMAVEAEIDVELRRYDDARHLLAQAIALAQAATPVNKTTLTRAYYSRGNIEQSQGQVEPAIVDYEAALTLSAARYDPADPWAVIPPGYILYQLGPLYLFQHKAQLALQRYTAALDIDKQDPFLYYLRGRVYRYLGNPDAARTEFQHCVGMDSQQWRCYRNLGQMAYEQTQWDAAAGFMQPIITANSQISDDHYYLGAAYIKLQQCQQAIPVLQRGVLLLRNATGKPYWKLADFANLLRACHASP